MEAGTSEEAAREAADDLPRMGGNATKAGMATVEIWHPRWVVIAGGIYTAILFSLLKLP